MGWIVSLFKNPMATLAVVFVAISGGLTIWVQSLRMSREKVKADLAKGEAEAVRHAVEAQNDARDKTSEFIEEGHKKRRRGDFSDIP